MSGQRNLKKAIMFYVPDFLYEEIKKHSKEQDSTITKYVSRAIVMRLNMEKENKDKIKW